MDGKTMTSLVDALYQVKYNPFKYGEYLASFYSKLHQVEENFLLLPLVIPLCSHPYYQSKISRAVFGDSRKSSIWSIFGDKTPLYDLQERIDHFQTLSDECLQYCLVNDWLEIQTENLSIIALANNNVFSKQKSAENLGKLFSGLSVIEIYTFLGVKP